MADKLSYLQIGEQIQHMTFLKDMPELEAEDKERIQQHLTALSSRQEDKFDNIIALIKKCDVYIDALQGELDEVKKNLDAWKKNKETLIKLIKFAFQQELISNRPTGVRYQGLFKKVRPRVEDNFSVWTDKDRKNYGVRQTTTIVRMADNEVLEVKEVELPDKERLRQALEEQSEDVPVAAELVPSYSFTYERRKRLTEG